MSPRHQRVLALTGAAAVVLVFAAANTHLVMVSVASQPDCVQVTSSEGTAPPRAAKPSC